MNADVHTIADDQVRSAFQRWKNLEEEKARIGDDLKELFAEQKAFGHDTKAMRAAFRLKVKMDEARPEDAEHEALVDTYLSALEAPRASRAYARENIEKIDRDERRRRRTTEAMDDHKSLVDEMADAGLISEEARHENKALADAVATKFGNSPAMPLRSDGGLSIFTNHEDIRTSDGSPSVSSSLATREAEESVVPHSPVTAAVPSSEQSEGNGSRDHQHVHSRQTDDAKHGGQDGEPAGPDHATHLPETANETMGGTGDDCSFGNRGVWPPQGGASSSRGNDSLSVVTAGETATIPQSDDGAIAAVNGKAGLANADGVEPPSSGQVEIPSNDDADHAAGANAGGDHVESIAERERDGTPTSNTGEGAACALPAKPKFVLRPYCRNPGETCGGSGTTHCHSCLKAREEVAA